MKISHNKVGQNVNISDSSRAERNQKTKSEGKSSVPEFMAPQSGVNLDLSDRAQDIKRIKELATAAPDVDEVKVAKFKKLIADGQYKVDSQALAEKMLNEYKEE
ncbi:MAG TPA: flagellar biosynthesis anti-sigma factor FlgM [Pseudobdellovibrionaceae bacterium]|jgi:negative regulator of flagellin synthesis FlgM|nr:flagellar biosynthesis anti-sigma factor FlgM [Pseudobdellovibrionaceae bacterium]